MEYVIKVRLDGETVGWVGRCPFFQYRLVEYWWEAMKVQEEDKERIQKNVERALDHAPHIKIELVRR